MPANAYSACTGAVETGAGAQGGKHLRFLEIWQHPVHTISSALRHFGQFARRSACRLRTFPMSWPAVLGVAGDTGDVGHQPMPSLSMTSSQIAAHVLCSGSICRHSSNSHSGKRRSEPAAPWIPWAKESSVCSAHWPALRTSEEQQKFEAPKTIPTVIPIASNSTRRCTTATGPEEERNVRGR